MEQITTIGIDLAKSVFQVHAVDASGHVVLQKTFRRAPLTAFLQKLPACLIGLEACSSAHHWGRLLTQFGHQALERRLLVWHRQDQASQRLATIPGVGIITATALAATVTDPSIFRSGREFAAFLGLVPRQNSSGGKDRLGRISKKGDGYLRKLLVVGATSVIRRSRDSAAAPASWINRLLERRPARVVTVAMANKTARIAWAVLARGVVYQPPVAA